MGHINNDKLFIIMGTKKELQKRILELEKLVDDKDYIINFMQLQLDNLRQFPTIQMGEDKCIDGNGHSYPDVWHSIIPPHCKKCGKQAQSYDITFIDNTGSPMSFKDFGGNMMYTNTFDAVDNSSAPATNTTEWLKRNSDNSESY